MSSPTIYLDADEQENHDLAVKAICDDYCRKRLLFNLCDFPGPDGGECPLADLALELLAPGYSRKYAHLQFVDVERGG